MRLARRTLLIAPLMFAARSARAHGYTRKAIDIRHPWTFARADAGRRDAIVGMTLRNSGATADRLIRVETRDAMAAEIVAPGGVIELAPGASVDLHPRGAHVLLRGVRKPLIAYDNLFVTLIFAKVGRVRVEIVVEDAPTG